MREVFSATTQHRQLLTYFIARYWVHWFLHRIEVPMSKHEPVEISGVDGNVEFQMPM